MRIKEARELYDIPDYWTNEEVKMYIDDMKPIKTNYEENWDIRNDRVLKRLKINF